MTKIAGDLKKLQGSWTVVELEVEGAKMPFGGSKIVIDGDQFTTVGMGSSYSGAMEIQPSKQPKTFDVLFAAGPHKGKRSLGIYELDGDTWRICMGFAGVKTRPEKFATAPKSGYALETLKRDRVAKAAAEEGPGAPTELDGEWAMVSGVMNGNAMPESTIKTGRRISNGNQLTVLFGKQVFLNARIQLDPAQSPKHVDYVLAAGGPAQLGIYQLDGKTLTVCMAAAGDPRPGDFSAARNSARSLTVWKLVRGNRA